MRVTTGTKKSEKFPGGWRTARPPIRSRDKALSCGLSK